MYKDKAKQKETDKVRQQRRRDAKKSKGVTIAGRDEGVTVIPQQSVTAPADRLQPSSMTADSSIRIIDNFSQPDCQCMYCQTNRVNGNKHIINHSKDKTAAQLAPRELNRQALPDDTGYAERTRTDAAGLSQ